jgi:NitT/TauT family transport system substrate-binding protein
VIVLHPILNTVLVFSGAIILCACQPKDESAKNVEETSSPTRLKHTVAEAEALVEAAFPWDRLVTNAFLPAENRSEPVSPKELQTLSVALPWLPNDQVPALWLGLARGFFKEEGLELDVRPGGPGRDPQILLLSGHVDLAISSSATSVIRLLSSETGGDIVTVGALQKNYPYAYIALDKSIPQTERSTRTLTAEDFRGRTLGMTPGGEFFLTFALQKLGLSQSDLKIIKAGSSLLPLTEGVCDFYTTMADNNPRKLEAMGFNNWVLWQLSDHGWIDYHNVITAHPKTAEERPEAIRGFMRALDRAVREILADPENAAEAILPYVEETGLTLELIQRRLEMQRPLTLATAEEPLLHMRKERWISAAAMLWRHGLIDLPGSP